MATPNGRTDPPLEQLLFEEPYRFHFFQAVRLLRHLNSARTRVGGESHPRDEAVRFRALNSLAFPASEIQELEPTDGGDAPPQMTVAFMGLTGPIGVLPEHYTEFLMARRREGQTAAAAFFDLFNHRIISLFFRAWEKYHPALARESGDPDRLAQVLFGLMGLGTESLHGQHEFPDAALLYYAGFFAQRRRPAVVLELILGDYFAVEIQVCQFVGRWITLDPSDRSTLGAREPENRLGEGVMLGGRVWDEQGKFRLRLGPLSYRQFAAFQPDGTAFRPLAQMTRLFVGGELDFEVQLVLKAEDIPACKLSSTPGAGARIGRHAWVQTRPRATDAEEAIFPAAGS